jgi:hypothetical protein
MDMQKKLTAATAAALVASALGGCGTETAPPPRAADRSRITQVEAPRAIDVAVLDDLQDRGDPLVVYGSLAEAAAAEKVVVTGIVDRVAAGPTTVDTVAPGLQVRDQTAVVRVRIERVYKAGGVSLDHGFAYLTMTRGAESTDADGVPTGDGPSTVTSIDALEKAMPAGARVVLATRPVPPATGQGSATVRNPNAGRPEGEPLLDGSLSQLFSIEDGDGRLTGWPSMTYDDAVAALEKALP